MLCRLPLNDNTWAVHAKVKCAHEPDDEDDEDDELMKEKKKTKERMCAVHRHPNNIPDAFL